MKTVKDCISNLDRRLFYGIKKGSVIKDFIAERRPTTTTLYNLVCTSEKNRMIATDWSIGGYLSSLLYCGILF